MDLKTTERIVFHEITKTAILNALESPRKINDDLVNAQQARRALDRLVGYELSPFLWKKIRTGLSAGRVQSVAVRLISDREQEIKKFVKEEFWTIEAKLKKQSTDESNSFIAKLLKKDNKNLDKFFIKNKETADKILDDVKDKDFIIDKIKVKEVKKKTPTPFTTSSLQQDAVNKLGFSAKQTMMIAQQLYEGIVLDNKEQIGLITYMRTDSTNLSSQAIDKTRDYIKNSIGKEYLPSKPKVYKTKSKGAQEAHEAIRPTFPEKTPDSIKKHLDDKQYKLYDLIWRRTIACQMKEAIMKQTSIDIATDNYTWRTSGSIIKFDGFLKVYQTKTKETILPELEEKETLDKIEIKPLQHFTEPPARYSEATLIKTLEEKGIGRPSTYAPTISTIQNRGYVVKNETKKFEPTEVGELVNTVLIKHFPNIVDFSFTANMEENLDKIAEGDIQWTPVIKNFYTPFKENLSKKEVEVQKKDLTEEKTDKKCEKCNSDMIIKLGRFGKFYACSNYPECKNTKPLETENAKTSQPEEETNELCEKCNSKMIYKMGRYGKFLACSNYPDCKNIKSIKKTTGVKCPDCKDGDILERKSKRGKIFYGCSGYPKCNFALWSKPINEKCPKCESILVLAAKEKIKCSNKECKFTKDQE